MTFTDEEKKGFEADTKKAREFRLALEQDMNVSCFHRANECCGSSRFLQSAHLLTLRDYPIQGFVQAGYTAFLKASLASKPGLAEKSTHYVLSYVTSSDFLQSFPTSASPAVALLPHLATSRHCAKTT